MTVIRPYDHHMTIYRWVWKKPRGERKITAFSMSSKWKHRYFLLTPDGSVHYFENAAGA